MLPGFYSFLWAFRTKESISQVNKPITHDVGKIVSSLGGQSEEESSLDKARFIFIFIFILCNLGL